MSGGRAERDEALAPLLVVFCACDRHNLGDLLFPHLAEALLAPWPVCVAGVVAADLTAAGGHRVRAIGEIAAEGRVFDVIHPGGEVLSCRAWEAAVMTLPADTAQQAVARYDRRPRLRETWARQRLGMGRRGPPYVLAPGDLPGLRATAFVGVGGVDLDRTGRTFRQQVDRALRAAVQVSVRDRVSAAHLAAAGILAPVVPDPAVLVPQRFGARVARHAGGGEPGRVRHAHPQGYLAVQLSAAWGDDASLCAVAGALAAIAGATGLAVVLFRAGAAPWHDDGDVYRRLAMMLMECEVQIFGSVDIWDLCALIEGSRAVVASSLHALILAAAFGRSGVGLADTASAGRKLTAYAETWPGQLPLLVTRPGELAAACDIALTQGARSAPAVAGDLVAAAFHDALRALGRTQCAATNASRGDGEPTLSRP